MMENNIFNGMEEELLKSEAGTQNSTEIEQNYDAVDNLIKDENLEKNQKNATKTEENNEKKAKNKKFFGIFVIYFIILSFFVFVRIASGFGLFSGIKNEIVSDIVSTTLIQIVILLLMPFLLYKLFFKRKTGVIAKEFGYKKLSFKAIMICFGIGALAFVLNLFVSNFFSIILGQTVNFHFFFFVTVTLHSKVLMNLTVS